MRASRPLATLLALAIIVATLAAGPAAAQGPAGPLTIPEQPAPGQTDPGPSLAEVAPAATRSSALEATVALSRTLEPGDNLVHGLIVAEGALWASLRTSPARILRIDPATLAYQRITLSPGLNVADDIVAAEGAIWTITYTSPSRLIRIDPATLAWDVAATIEGLYADSLAYAFGSLWVGGADRAIARVSPGDGRYELFTYPALPPRTLVHALTSGGGYLWANAVHYTAGGFFTPSLPYASTILRISPASPDAPASVALDQYMHDDMAFFDGALYSGSEEPPSYMHRISLDLAVERLPSTDAPSYGTFVNPGDPDHVWGAYLGNPGQVRIFHRDGTTAAVYSLPAGFRDANELAFGPDGSVYATAWESPARLVKFAPLARGGPDAPSPAARPLGTDRLFLGAPSGPGPAAERSVPIAVGRNFGGLGGRPTRMTIALMAGSSSGGAARVSLNDRDLGEVELPRTPGLVVVPSCERRPSPCDPRDQALLRAPTALGSGTTTPPPVVNELRVTGPADTELGWAAIGVAGDVLPILFVHGWAGGAGSFGPRDDEPAAGSFAGWAAELGVPYLAPAAYNHGLDDEQTWLAALKADVERLRARYGVGKVNVVAHSRGGVVGRLGLDDPGFAGSVDGLVTISSPHHGSDLMTIAAADSCPKLPADRQARCREVAAGLMRDVMRYVNYGPACEPIYVYIPKPNGSVTPTLAGYKGCVEQFGGQRDQAERVNLRAISGLWGDIARPEATLPWLNSCAAWPEPSGIRLDALFDHSHTDMNRKRDVFDATLRLLREGRPRDAAPPNLCAERPQAAPQALAAAVDRALAPAGEAISLRVDPGLPARAGEPLALRAWLDGAAAPEPGVAALTATVDGAAYTLQDDDRDGIYIAVLPGFPRAGIHPVALDAAWPGGSAAGAAAIVVLGRLASVVEVGPGQAVDLDGRGRWQALAFPVTVDAATGGVLTLGATLRAPDGGRVARLAAPVHVRAGQSIVSLRVEGAAIRGALRDGPYTLSDIALTGSLGGELTDHRPELVAMSEAYQWREFTGEAIELRPGLASVAAPGGGPASLSFSATVGVEAPGDYAWTAALYTADGRLVARSAPAQRPIDGVGQIAILFTLAEVRAAGPGPYELRELSVWQVGGYLAGHYGLGEAIATWSEARIYLPAVTR